MLNVILHTCALQTNQHSARMPGVCVLKRQVPRLAIKTVLRKRARATRVHASVQFSINMISSGLRSMSGAECIARGAGCSSVRCRDAATRENECESVERASEGTRREPRNNEADLSVTQESEPGFRWPCTRI